MNCLTFSMGTIQAAILLIVIIFNQPQPRQTVLRAAVISDVTHISHSTAVHACEACHRTAQ